MPTIAEIRARLARYDAQEKGLGRTWLYGDNIQIKYLRGILALPHIGGYSELPLAKLQFELKRLGIDYDSVYTREFRRANHASSRLFQDLFAETDEAKTDETRTNKTKTDAYDYDERNITTPLDLPEEPVPLEEPAPSEWPEDKIKKFLEVLRDKLIFYIATVEAQPRAVLFAADYLGSGGSGFAGRARAQTFLNFINAAIQQYTTSGTMAKIFSEADLMPFGKHTVAMIEPTLHDLFLHLSSRVGIKDVSFSSKIDTKIHDGEIVIAHQTTCKLLKRRPDGSTTPLIDKVYECEYSLKAYCNFFDDYLSKVGFCFKPASSFPLDAFSTAFKQHLTSLEAREIQSRNKQAAEKRSEREKIKGSDYHVGL